MLTFRISTSASGDVFIEAGKWIRRCVDPVRDLAKSYWKGLSISTHDAAHREGHEFVLEAHLARL